MAGLAPSASSTTSVSMNMAERSAPRCSTTSRASVDWVAPSTVRATEVCILPRRGHGHGRRLYRRWGQHPHQHPRGPGRLGMPSRSERARVGTDRPTTLPSWPICTTYQFSSVPPSSARQQQPAAAARSSRALGRISASNGGTAGGSQAVGEVAGGAEAQRSGLCTPNSP